MNLRLLILSTMLLSAAAGCKPPPAGPPAAGEVIFQAAGISLVPGDAWKQAQSENVGSSSWGQACPPHLQGEGPLAGSVIQVFSADHSKPKTQAERLRLELQANPAVLQTSLALEPFEAEHGADGVHLFYNEKVERPSGKWLARTHAYIVQNRQGQCVTVRYMAMADRDSADAREMIRKTLRLR